MLNAFAYLLYYAQFSAGIISAPLPTTGPDPLPLYKGYGAGSHHICQPVYKCFLWLHHIWDTVSSFDTPTQYNTMTDMWCKLHTSNFPG